jgi:hypothetical protein
VRTRKQILQTGCLQCPASKITKLAYPEADRGDRLLSLLKSPSAEKNGIAQLSDRFRVSGADECPNWTSTWNDRSGEPNRNSWPAATDRLRCRPVPELPGANVSNVVDLPPIE